METEVAGTLDPAALERAIVEVLARNPGSTARQILGALPAIVRSGLTRRDVNSVLYRGSGSTFIRSEDEKPRWRLACSATPSMSLSSERAQRAPRRTIERPVPPTSVGSMEDAPAPKDIARILFED